MKNGQENEKIMKNIVICKNVKLFGKCQNALLCNERHLLSEQSELVPGMPRVGKVTFKIIKMADVTRFVVQLISHVGVGHFGNRDDLHKPLFYPEGCEKKRAVDIKAGGFYALCDHRRDNDSYMLCEVRHFDSTKNDRAVEIEVFANRNVIMTDKKKLFELPPDLTCELLFLF